MKAQHAGWKISRLNCDTKNQKEMKCKQRVSNRTASCLLISHVIFLLLFLSGIVIGACGEQPKLHVAGLTDLDFNDDGFINQTDLDILKSHFNERYKCYAPWDLNADLHCDYKDFYYFADRVPLNYRYEVAANMSVWNMSNYTIKRGNEPALILDEAVFPQSLERTATWVQYYTSLEPPKNDSAVCVHYARDLCRLAYKTLGPKTIAWGSSGVHTYGMIYTGGNWSVLSNWAIIDPFWKLYGLENYSNTWNFHRTKTIKILLEEGRYGYWAIHLSADFLNNTVFDPYKAEFRVKEFREPS
jgi:hypothetical protein